MSRKILIEVKFEKPSKYKKFLSERETLFGKETLISYIGKNMGDEVLPKGRIICTMFRPTGMGTFSQESRPIEMPALKPKETFAFATKGEILAPGLWLLKINVEFEEKKEIEYYREEDEKPDKEKWQTGFLCL